MSNARAQPVQFIDNTGGLAALYSGMLENAAQLKSAADGVDGKSGVIMSAAIAVVALVASVDSSHNILTGPGIFVLIIAAVLAVGVLARGEYSTPVTELNTSDVYLSMESGWLLLHLIADAQQAINENFKILKSKGVLYKWALITFPIGVTISIIPNLIRIFH